MVVVKKKTLKCFYFLNKIRFFKALANRFHVNKRKENIVSLFKRKKPNKANKVIYGFKVTLSFCSKTLAMFYITTYYIVLPL